MNRFPRLNFPTYRFRVRESTDGGLQIWDEVRKQWLVLTPEEWVRRHMLRYLASEQGFPPELTVQECPVCIEGTPQRADIVVHDREGNPFLLVECKAPGIILDGAVYAQAVRYNTVLKAPYIILTNGLKHFIYQHSDGYYTNLDTFSGIGFEKENKKQ